MRNLENYIFYVREALDKAVDIKNKKFKREYF